MFNKDNVFITVNEEVSSIIQQYIIREIKKILDKYKSITAEEISSVEKLINSVSNEELKEEFLNDWSMSVKIAKEIGENEVDDRIISMYQNLKSNGLEELSIGHVINWLYFILNLCAKFSLKSQPSIYGKYGKWIL